MAHTDSRNDVVDGMKKYFRVVEKGEHREFWCLKCKQGWQLRTANNHPGNYLKLLDHAHSHD
jgi:hypothetical protein